MPLAIMYSASELMANLIEVHSWVQPLIQTVDMFLSRRVVMCHEVMTIAPLTRWTRIVLLGNLSVHCKFWTSYEILPSSQLEFHIIVVRVIVNFVSVTVSAKILLHEYWRIDKGIVYVLLLFQMIYFTSTRPITSKLGWR